MTSNKFRQFLTPTLPIVTLNDPLNPASGYLSPDKFMDSPLQYFVFYRIGTRNRRSHWSKLMSAKRREELTTQKSKLIMRLLRQLRSTNPWRHQRQLLYLFYSFEKNSHTWINEYLWIAATCLQWPSAWGPTLNFYYTSEQWPPVFGSRGWLLYTSLTVVDVSRRQSYKRN